MQNVHLNKDKELSYFYFTRYWMLKEFEVSPFTRKCKLFSLTFTYQKVPYTFISCIEAYLEQLVFYIKTLK